MGGGPAAAAAVAAGEHPEERATGAAAVQAARTAEPDASTAAAAATQRASGSAASGRPLTGAAPQAGDPLAPSRPGDADGAAAVPRGEGNLEPLPPGIDQSSVLYSDRRAVQAIGRIDRGADQNEGLNGTLDQRTSGEAEEGQTSKENLAAGEGQVAAMTGAATSDALATGGAPGGEGAASIGAARVEASSSAPESAVSTVREAPVEYGPALPPPGVLLQPVLRPHVMRAGLGMLPPAFPPMLPIRGGAPVPSAAAPAVVLPSTPEIVAIMDKLIEFIKARAPLRARDQGGAPCADVRDLGLEPKVHPQRPLSALLRVHVTSCDRSLDPTRGAAGGVGLPMRSMDGCVG